MLALNEGVQNTFWENFMLNASDSFFDKIVDPRALFVWSFHSKYGAALPNAQKSRMAAGDGEAHGCPCHRRAFCARKGSHIGTDGLCMGRATNLQGLFFVCVV